MKARFTLLLLVLAFCAGGLWHCTRDFVPVAGDQTASAGLINGDSLGARLTAGEADVPTGSAAERRGDGAGEKPAVPFVLDFARDVEVLAEVQSAPDAEGRVLRTRVVKRQKAAKYQLLRLQETLARPAAGQPERVLRQLAMVADHIVVKLQSFAKKEELVALNAKFGAEIRKAMHTPGLYLVSIPGRDVGSLTAAVARYKAEAATVAWAEPDYLVRHCATPDDPQFSQLWGMHNTGQTGGTVDADIDAPEAWNIATGSASLKVGVIDTGIEYTHPDLSANIWLNPGEVAGNGIDDDSNGFIDDVRGWDFANDDNNPMDDHFHGTHVAGTIAGRGNNATGVTGVCWRAALVPLKFLDASGGGYTSDAVDAVNYATRIGVKLTSNSWGGGAYSQALKDAIDAAGAAGILFVAAAGNDGLDNDLYPSYPASYDSANIIAVAATDHNDRLASFSNYGRVSVDLAAPGVNIFSSSLNAGYRSVSGTSMATPHVAGACALVWSNEPALSASQLKARLLERADGRQSLAGKVASSGRLNLFNALDSAWMPKADTQLASMTLSDSLANGNGYPEPGEAILLTPTFANFGQLAASGVTASVSCSSPDVSLVDATEDVGAVPAKSEVTRANAFRLQISSTALVQQVTLTVTIRDAVGTVSTGSYSFFITTPQPQAFVPVNFAVGEILADPVRNLIYVTDKTHRRLLAIDMTNGQQVQAVALAGPLAIAPPVSSNTPRSGHMAVSLDGSRLYVALTEAKKIQVFTLPGLSSQAVFSYSFAPVSLACGAGNRLYASSTDYWGKIRLIDASSGAVLSSFNDGGDFYMHALLRVNAAGTRLFVGETGLRVEGGPGYIREFDISGSTPAYLKQHPFVELYLADFAIDEQYRRVYTMNGGIYAIQLTEMDTGVYGATWPFAAAYASAVTFLPGSPYVYGAVPGLYDADIRQFARADGAALRDYEPMGSSGDGKDGFSRHVRIAANGKLLSVKNQWRGDGGGYEGYNFWIAAVGLSSLSIPNFVPPQAKITATPIAGVVPLTYRFDGSASTGSPGSTIVSYSWNFGDGSTGTGANVSHTYTALGTYTARLEVLDSLGFTASSTHTLTYAPPQARITATPLEGAVPLSVGFNAAASSGSTGSTIVEYRWNFGDGSTGTGVSVSHLYTTVNTFTATLTVVDSAGFTASSQVTITSNPAMAVVARINFQPVGLTPPTGWTPDTGKAYDAFKGFGWINGTESQIYPSSSSNLALDYLKRTYHFIYMNRTTYWEYALPAGEYFVRVTCGRPDYGNAQHYVNVEGVTAIDVSQATKDVFTTKMVQVAVSDGKLTVQFGRSTTTQYGCLNWLEIYRQDNQPPVIESLPVATPNPVTLPAATTVSVVGTDDGQPAAPGALTYTWSQLSGPGITSFSPNGSSGSASSSAAFSAPGSYTLQVSVSDGAAAVTAELSVTVNPSPVVVTLTATDASASEPGTNPGRFRVSRNTSVGALTVEYTLSGTASNGVDYQALPGSVTLLAGTTYKDIVLTPLNDSLGEGLEKAVAALKANPSYTLGASSTATVNITDDEPLITVSVYDSLTAEPGTDTGRFRVSRSGSTAASLTVSIAVSGTATPAVDYLSLPGSVTIPAAYSYVDVLVSPLDDTVIETAESVTLTVSGNAGYLPGTTSSGTLYIVDNEYPIASVRASDAIASEPGTDPGTFTFTRTGSTTESMTIYYALSGTATQGLDYVALPGSVTIAAGATSATALLTPSDDGLVEGKETVLLTLLASPSYQRYTYASASLTLVDDELPVVTIVATDALAAEPADAGLFTLSRTGNTAAPLAVKLALGGTALNGVDYDTLPSTVTIAAGASTATVALSVRDDLLVEGKRTVTLTLAAAPAYQVVSSTSATVTIFDDEKPEVKVAATDSYASEPGTNTGRITFTRTPATAAPLSVGFTFSGTATNGVDHQGLPLSVTFSGGMASATVLVQPLDDTLHEGTESVKLTLSSDGAYELGSATATVSIYDND